MLKLLPLGVQPHKRCRGGVVRCEIEIMRIISMDRDNELRRCSEMTNAGKSSSDGYVMSTTWLLLGLSSCYGALQSVGFLGVAFFEDIPRASLSACLSYNSPAGQEFVFVFSSKKKQFLACG
jgi:hypothetical protein